MELIALERLEINVIDGDRGKNYPHQDELLEKGDCLFLSAKNVTTNGFDFSNNQFITSEKDEMLRNGKLKRGDIVITTRGTVGNVALYDDNVPYDSIRINSGMLIVRCGDNLSREYIYNVLRSPWFYQKIKSIQTGSAQPQLPKSHFLKMEIPIPDKNVQDKIADIIMQFDRKMACNSAINRNLSEQSQMIVKSYMNDKVFEMTPLSEIADIIDCLHSKKPDSIIDGTKQLIQLGNITDTGFLDMEAVKYMISDDDYAYWIRKCEIQAGDCIITNVGRVGAVSQAPAGTYAAMGRNMTCIRLKTGNDWSAYLITILLSDHIKQEISKNTDVGTIMNALNVKDIPKLLFPVFGNKEMKNLEDTLKPFRRFIESNYLANQRLSALRDALLPKLMSGELDITNLEI